MPATPYAGLVTRAIALLVDALVINVLAAIVGAAIGLIGSLAGASKPGIAAAVTGGALWLGWTGLYFVAFWTVTGQTPGARLLGIRVSPSGPRELGIVRASLRFVVMMLALIPLGAGYVTVLFDDRRRGPHDMVASTVVRWASAAAVAAAIRVESAAAAGPPVIQVDPAATAGPAATPPEPATPADPTATPAEPATPADPTATPATSDPPAEAPPSSPAAASSAPTRTGPPAVSGEVVGPARGDRGDDGAGPRGGRSARVDRR